MKTTKRILALLLVVLMSLSFFVSCGKDDRGEIMATYNNGTEFIYENDTDFKDFFMLNSYYYLSEQGKNSLTVEEYNKILSTSVESTVIWRKINEDLLANDLSVDEKAVKDAALRDAEQFEKNYKGGYKAFRETWNISESAFEMTNKYGMILDVLAENVLGAKKPTDEEVKQYYVDYSYNYVVMPHYSVSSIVLQVTDKVPANEVLADAQSYIDMLKSGKSWDEVKSAASIKYNYENGMIYSEIFTGEEKVYLKDFVKVTDLDAAIAEIDAAFKAKNGVSFDEIFPNGFEAYAKANNLTAGDEAYNAANDLFYNYTAQVYNAEFKYIISTAWEDGKTYDKPLFHEGTGCYAVVTFNSIVEEAGFADFDTVKDQIASDIFDTRKQEVVSAYTTNIINKYVYGITE